MALRIVVTLLILSVLTIKYIEAGGGNAGGPNCWFYREHFNVTLEMYQKKIDRWVQHISDQEMVYIAKNPFQHPKYLNNKIDEIVENSIKIFDTYKMNIIDETALLCGVNVNVIKSAMKSVQSFNFPIYCLQNLPKVQQLYDEAIEKVEHDKNEMKRQ